jgi:hypothetical protein
MPLYLKDLFPQTPGLPFEGKTKVEPVCSLYSFGKVYRPDAATLAAGAKPQPKGYYVIGKFPKGIVHFC